MIIFQWVISLNELNELNQLKLVLKNTLLLTLFYYLPTIIYHKTHRP